MLKYTFKNGKTILVSEMNAAPSVVDVAEAEAAKVAEAEAAKVAEAEAAKAAEAEAEAEAEADDGWESPSTEEPEIKGLSRSQRRNARRKQNNQ